MNFRIVEVESLPDLLLRVDNDEEENDVVVMSAFGNDGDCEDQLRQILVKFPNRGMCRSYIQSFSSADAYWVFDEMGFCKDKRSAP